MCTNSYCQRREEGRIGNDSKWFGWWRSGNWNKDICFSAVAQWQHAEQGGCAPSPLWAAPSWETPELCLGRAGAVSRAWPGPNLEELGLSDGSCQFYNSKKQTSSFAQTPFAASLPPSPPTSYGVARSYWGDHGIETRYLDSDVHCGSCLGARYISPPGRLGPGFCHQLATGQQELWEAEQESDKVFYPDKWWLYWFLAGKDLSRIF